MLGSRAKTHTLIHSPDTPVGTSVASWTQSVDIWDMGHLDALQERLQNKQAACRVGEQEELCAHCASILPREAGGGRLLKQGEPWSRERAATAHC